MLSFSGPRLRVPVVTSGPRTDPREKLLCIIEICKVKLESIQGDEQNPEIVSKIKEFEFLTKFAWKMKFSKIEVVLN